MTADPRRPGCPPWCTTNHAANVVSCTADGHALTLLDGTGVITYARRSLSLGEHLTVLASRARLHLTEADDASALATLVEALAAATPEQHREIADAIRHEAALLGWEVPDAAE